MLHTVDEVKYLLQTTAVSKESGAAFFQRGSSYDSIVQVNGQLASHPALQ